MVQTRFAAVELAAANEELAREFEVRGDVQAALEGTQKEQADQRFDRLADSMSTALICVDYEGRITSWNRAAETIFGYRENEAIGQLSTIIVSEQYRPDDDAAGLARMITDKYAGKTIELMALRKNGKEFPAELSLSTWTEDGRPAIGAIIRDITDRVEAQERLKVLAYRDQLTGLPNRQAFTDALRSVAGSNDREGATLLLLDLDGFKAVNDSRGHSSGDIVLIACADRLRDSVPDGATVSRLGGDEFAILLPAGAEVSSCVARILKAFEMPIHAGGRPFQLGTSIGIVRFPEQAVDVDELLIDADLALYHAKSLGGGRCEFFTLAMSAARRLRQTMEMELLRAYKRGEFELFYQPLVRLSDGWMTGAEALLRWHHPEQGMLSPDAFFPTLENTSLAEAIGSWVLQTACAQGARWQRFRPMRVGVNLFAAQFQSGNLQGKVAQALAASGLAPHLLELEITENIALANNDAMIEPLRTLRNLGVGIAFDDFGTGFGSMSMLKRFPVTRLKIDRSFVNELVENKDDVGIVRAVIELGRSLGMEVIAEGVENEEQHRLLIALDCGEGQGFYYGRPMPAAEFDILLDKPALRRVSG